MLSASKSSADVCITAFWDIFAAFSDCFCGKENRQQNCAEGRYGILSCRFFNVYLNSNIFMIGPFRLEVLSSCQCENGT